MASIFPDISLSKVYEKEEEKPKEKPIVGLGEVAAETPYLITKEDIERIKEIGQKFGKALEKVKEYISSREERKAEEEINKLKKEIEKLGLLKEKAKRLEELEREKEALKKQIEEMKKAKLKQAGV